MISLKGLGKPQYLFRPSQIVKRLLQEVRSARPGGQIELPWRLRIGLDPGDTVSEGIFRQGVYDVVTTELLWRLTLPGDCAVDIGANIGYMTSVLAVRAGRQGSVFSFEPHPKTYSFLKANADVWNASGKCAPVTAVQAAVSDKDGSAILEMPSDDDPNASHARLGSATGKGIEVPVTTFASYFTSPREFGVVKVDAEGHEPAVFAGMSEYLGRVREIVFEEYADYPAPSHQALERAGYTVFAMEERLSGPQLRPATNGARVRRAYDIVPSYVATLDAARLRRILGTRRWQSLSGS